MPVLTLRDGVNLAYEDVGQGPLLLLVHGWGVNGRFFHPQIEALADSFRLIAPDLRGHGRTPGVAPMTIGQLADDVTQLTEALDLTDVVGVGWSMGAQVLWTALLGPARPRFVGMVAVDMGPRIVSDGGWTLGVKRGYESSTAPMLQQVMQADWPAYAAFLANGLVADGAQGERTELIAWVTAEVSKNVPGPLADLWGSVTVQDFRDTLGGLDLPVLIAHGAKSQLYTAQTAADLAARLPDARIVAFEHSGHAPNLEEPETFNTTIADFAQAIFGNPKT
jgi:pimeloyl-[acyl-carrier protein] methyl ester esterase